MAPQVKNNKVWVVSNDETIDGVYPTEATAKARIGELDGATYKQVELKGATLNIVETKPAKAAPKPKAAKKEKVKEEDDEEEEPAPKAAAKKTKTPAEQRTANSEKPAKPTDANLPENVQELLLSMGSALEGKAIVVTGVPPTLGRKNAEKLVVNFGGKLTKSLSKNTSLVVVGNDAGPTKLDKIEELGIKTIDEDGFIALLEAGSASGGTKRAADADEKPKAKKAKK